MIITFRVIPNIVRMLLILTQFWLFDLVENMFNDVVVPFFKFKLVKKGQNLIFKCSMDIYKMF